MSLDTDQLKVVRSTIKTELKDTFNRLHSIAFDAKFVSNEIRNAFPGFPIIPNLRAGEWYVNPLENSTSTTSAYFKSTDGHANEHKWSSRRTNLNLLHTIKSIGGIVIVDVTRRGKRFPDAFSKTIPMWCAVLNLARTKLVSPSEINSTVSIEGWKEDGKLWTLPSAVSRSEHAQIEAKIDEWSNILLSSAYDLSILASLTKPLRPIFISPASNLGVTSPKSYVNFYPIVLVSASKLSEEAEDIERSGGFTYVQGGGDDHELWSRGLTPGLFWKNFDTLLSSSRPDLEEVIASILATSLSVENLHLEEVPSSSNFLGIRQTSIEIDFQPSRSQKPSNIFSFVSIDLDKSALVIELDSTSNLIVLKPKAGKGGYPSFFDPLQVTLDAILRSIKAGKFISIRLFYGNVPAEANDLGIALAMIVLFNYYDSNGNFKSDNAKQTKGTKSEIRARLQWILEKYPSANPSRSILNRVNSYLMPF